MAISIKIEGIESAQKFLDKVGKDTFNNANAAIIKAGFYIEGEVKQSIAGHRAEPRSVDTGRFLNSVKNVQNAPLTANIETNVPYAGVLEYGATNRAPRAHFRNTATRNEKKVKEFVESEIKKL